MRRTRIPTRRAALVTLPAMRPRTIAALLFVSACTSSSDDVAPAVARVELVGESEAAREAERFGREVPVPTCIDGTVKPARMVRLRNAGTAPVALDALIPPMTARSVPNTVRLAPGETASLHIELFPFAPMMEPSVMMRTDNGTVLTLIMVPIVDARLLELPGGAWDGNNFYALIDNPTGFTAQDLFFEYGEGRRVPAVDTIEPGRSTKVIVPLTEEAAATGTRVVLGPRCSNATLPEPSLIVPPRH
jgi:hypothetical protein